MAIRVGGIATRKLRDVVSTSGSGIDTGDFTERRSNTDDDYGDGNPAPKDIDGSATDQGVVEGRRETVWDRGEDEGHEGDLEGRSVSGELRLVAQVLEQLVGRVGAVGARVALELLVDIAARVLFKVGGRHGYGWQAWC